MLKLRSIMISTKAAIDLASIMVGIIVIGVVAGVIAATVFAVIPWAQDNAAKTILNSVANAESAYQGFSADDNRTGATEFGNKKQLEEYNKHGTKKLLDVAPNLQVQAGLNNNSRPCWAGLVVSDTGNLFLGGNQISSPVQVNSINAANTRVTQFCNVTFDSTTHEYTAFTWTERTVPAAFYDSGQEPIVAASGNQNVIVLGGYLNDGSNCVTATSCEKAYVSKDNGVSWTKARSAQMDNDEYATVQAAGVSRNGNTVLIGGTHTNQGTPYLSKSTDGGTTFTDIIPVAGDPFNTFWQQCRSANAYPPRWSDLWVSNDGQTIRALFLGNNRCREGVVAESTNGGTTWTTVGPFGIPGPVFMTATAQGTISSNGQYMVVSDSSGSDGRGDTAYSTDGGKTWQYVPNQGLNGAARWVSVSDDGKVFNSFTNYNYSSTTFKSAPGATGWGSVTTSSLGPYMGYGQYSFGGSSDRGFQSNQGGSGPGSGRINMTLDGGQTWFSTYQPGTNNETHPGYQLATSVVEASADGNKAVFATNKKFFVGSWN